jgi:hypothetical protein
MSEMGSEQVESLERGLVGEGLDVPGIEPGELGPAEPESSPEADARQSWLGDSAAREPADSGSERLEAGLGGELMEPGEAGPAEPAEDALPGDPGQLASDLGGLPGDLGQAAGTVERGLSGDLGQASGDVTGLAGAAGSAERVVSRDAGKATGSAESAGKDVAEGMAERAGKVAESLLPGGDATGTGPQPGESSRPRVEPGLAHDDTQARPARSGVEAPGLRLDTPRAPEQAPRSQPR